MELINNERLYTGITTGFVSQLVVGVFNNKDLAHERSSKEAILVRNVTVPEPLGKRQLLVQ